MKIELTEIYGWQAAIRAMRNSWNSWDKTDSCFIQTLNGQEVMFGPNDKTRVLSLVKAGSEHRKFLRQVIIWADFTLPLYVWPEFDTYKVGTTRNSCSTIHTLMKRPLTHEDFDDPIPKNWIDFLNIGMNIENMNVGLFKGHLPSSYLLKSTITANYEVYLNMYFQRRNHKLQQWSGTGGICEWIKNLPHMELFINTIEAKNAL
jgi:hypothetical protein